ncbi:MAG: DUF5060 domain-containing protein [Bacteroidales bacterium]|nr:DUF5060 domain-containing protein [Bacteroidales bacterium]
MTTLLIPLLIQSQPVIIGAESNSGQIGKFEKLEITVQMEAQYENPYNYSEINLKAIFTSPSGYIDTVDGFYIQEYEITDSINGLIDLTGPPKWMIRYSPDEPGTWNYSIYCVDINGVSNTLSQEFSCFESNLKGFIRKSNNGYLKYDSGDPCFPIGENMGWCLSNFILDYRNWLDSLSFYGGNFVRVWMASWAFGIEWNNTGLGNYSNRQNHAFYLDYLVNCAQERSVNIELCFGNHGELVTQVFSPEWQDNPYNAANGGPCIYPWDFFTNSIAQDFYKNRIRYILARWGYSKNIFAWEFFNEIDLMDGYNEHKADVRNWTDEMAVFTRQNDVNKHLISTSFCCDRCDPETWDLESIDYTQNHYYDTLPDNESVLNQRISAYIDQFQKPVKIGEYGIYGDMQENLYKDPEGINIHNVIWSNAFSGAFGTAMPWSWDYYIHPQHLYRYFKPLNEFISPINLNTQEFEPVSFDCASDESSSYTFTPLYWPWEKPPENLFLVSNQGKLIPETTELSVYLFGALYNTELRNPPTFLVNYPEEGTFMVKTGPNSGESPTIEIWLDGVIKLNMAGVTNTEYSITVPSGNHTIQLDNQGTDWIEISSYSLDHYIPVIKSNALVGTDIAFGWVHNRKYNWKYVFDNGIPDAAENCKIYITGLNEGVYQAEFYDCIQNEIVGTTTGYCFNQTMWLDCPDISWDYAYRIDYLSPLNLSETEPVSPVVYPNPANNTLYVNNKINALDFQIFNLDGRLLSSGPLDNNPIDLSMLRSGLYILILASEKGQVVTKVCKIE